MSNAEAYFLLYDQPGRCCFVLLVCMGSHQEANDNHVGIICISGINIAGNMAKWLWKCMKG